MGLCARGLSIWMLYITKLFQSKIWNKKTAAGKGMGVEIADGLRPIAGMGGVATGR